MIASSRIRRDFAIKFILGSLLVVFPIIFAAISGSVWVAYCVSGLIASIAMILTSDRLIGMIILKISFFHPWKLFFDRGKKSKQSLDAYSMLVEHYGDMKKELEKYIKEGEIIIKGGVIEIEKNKETRELRYSESSSKESDPVHLVLDLDIRFRHYIDGLSEIQEQIPKNNPELISKLEVLKRKLQNDKDVFINSIIKRTSVEK